MDETLVALLSKQTAILEQIATRDLHTKAPANAGNAVELHGVGSLFGNQSVEREVVTAHIRPVGLGASLTVIPTVFVQPFYAAITGYTDVVGSEAETPCADNPAGYMKSCYLTAQFGRVARDTRTIEVNDVMLRKNRGDFTDLILYGKLLGMSGFNPAGMTEDDVLNVVTKAEMVTAVVNLERALANHLWNGNPANNNAGGGYKEFPGLSRQIATGQVDAETNAACPALDSDVKSFAYDDVCGTGRDIAEYLSMLEAYLYFNASRMGLLPWTAVLCMRPELWYVLTDCWPCRYNTSKCATAVSDANVQVNVGGESMIALRDAMRNGMYIDINGRRYPVIVDDGIFEHNNINNGNLGAGEYASSIFFVPLTIAGGLPVTYLEHVDYRKAASDIALLRGKEDFWSDDGRYFWALEQVKWCYKLSVKTEQRVVLRTPQLAGRIDYVKYVPLQHFRSPDPDSPYFADGGVSLRGDTSFYHVW